MIILENVYASDIDKLVNWMKENDSVKNSEELTCLMQRMETDIHNLKIGKSKFLESTSK